MMTLVIFLQSLTQGAKCDKSRRSAPFFACLALLSLLCGERINAQTFIKIPAPAPLPSPNAYDVFVRASALKPEPPLAAQSAAQNGNSGLVQPGFDDATLQALRPRIQEALGLVRIGLREAYCQPARRQTGGYDPHCASFRSLARAIRFEANMQARSGDYAGAMTTRLDGMQFGAMVPQGGDMFARLVGIAIEAIARKEMWADVNHLNAEQARRAAERLESIDTIRKPVARSLEEDKWVQL